MLYREIIAVCSEIHTKHTNTVCGQNGEFLNVKLVVRIVTTGVCIVQEGTIQPFSLPTHELKRNTPNAICLFCCDVPFKCRRSQSAVKERPDETKGTQRALQILPPSRFVDANIY